MTSMPMYCKRYFNSFVVMVVFVMTLIYQTGIITLDSAHLMIFTGCSLGLVMLQLFYKRPILRYAVPMFIFLGMLLFIHTNPYTYLGLTLLFAILTFWLLLSSGETRLTWLYGISLLLIGTITIFLKINLVPLIVPLYFGCCVITSDFDRKHKWSYVIVGLLSLASVIATIKDSVFIEMRYTIFSIPIALLIYVLVVKGKALLSGTYKIIESRINRTTMIALMLYAYAFAVTTNTRSSYILFVTFGSLLLALSIILHAWTQRSHRLATRDIASKLDSWFVSKWEDALADREASISWRAFDEAFNKVVSNDGIIVTIDNQDVYQSGFARSGIPESAMTLQAQNLSITVHKRRNTQNYSLRDMITNNALLSYLTEQNKTWQQVKKISISDQATPMLNQDLALRKNITYYLHDNILQNIIATKNIVSMLASDQVALQDLAVTTLSELNDSIRSQIHEIYPSSLHDLPFERNIHILIDELRKKYLAIPALNITYDIYDPLDAESAYVFYRALQELLNNTSKYAQADNLWISMQTVDDKWQLQYRDDGLPLEDGSESKLKHLGLSSLYQQVHALKGSFTIDNDLKQFTIKLPRGNHENRTV